jgi:polysaccharide biosynthesis transport protein
VSELPVPFEKQSPVPVLAQGRSDQVDPVQVPLEQMWGVLRRHLLLIAIMGVLSTGAAVTYVLHTTPVYQGTTTLRIDDKSPNLPEVFRTLVSGGEVVTELEVLRSRSLVEAATQQLNLQVRLVNPSGVNRDDLLSNLSVAKNAVPGRYVLRRTTNGRFRVSGEAGSVPGPDVAPGSAVHIGGLAFTLSPASRQYSQLELVVLGLDEAVIVVRNGISVGQGNRETRVVSLSYRDTDRQLAWQVPNIVAEQFIARRQDAQKAAARSTVAFLRQQLDTLSGQLNASERALQKFREREHVVNPVIEGNTQVERLIRLQSDRSALEAERAALAGLLKEVDVSATRSPTDRSPYRRLLAFPTLLRSQASTELLRSLSEVEDQRSQLLSRRTSADPEVQALDGRVREIEEQLRSVATTYLEGLTRQVASIDTSIRGFGLQLSRVPGRELEFAQLQRQPKVLEEMYSLLQTRLKEAEIAQAVDDPSIQIVDRAVRPLQPVLPRRRLSIVFGVMFGLLFGVGLAFLREYLDKSVHTRTDVRDATGLPVLGLIPRIPRPGKRVALISERRESQPRTLPVRPRLDPPGASNDRPYTFFPVDPVSEPVVQSALDHISDGGPVRSQRMTITGIGTAIAEAYGSLQTNLLHSRFDQPVQTVVFTSAQPGEGKTTIVVNLAISLTHRGGHVLLIDADLRRGVVHSVFDVPREPGFADVVQGAVPLEHACRSVEVEQGGVLHYLTSGTLPPNPSALLASREVKSFLRSMRERYETIIIDSPPVNMMTDAALLGSNADGVVLVARAGVTHSEALGYALEALGHVRASVLGVVLNDIDFRRDATYDAAYRYYDYGQYTANSAG